MLPQFYLDYLKTYLPDSELLTLQILVWLLQVHRQVRIERLASSFPYPIKCESRRKKIQRFLILPKLSIPLEIVYKVNFKTSITFNFVGLQRIANHKSNSRKILA